MFEVSTVQKTFFNNGNNFNKNNNNDINNASTPEVDTKLTNHDDYFCISCTLSLYQFIPGLNQQEICT